MKFFIYMLYMIRSHNKDKEMLHAKNQCSQKGKIPLDR